MRIRPDLQLAGRLALRDFRVERRPFRTPFAALEAESGLLTAHAVVAIGRVDRHVAGMAFLVAELVGAGLEDLEIVVARKPLDAVGAGNAHLVLGLGVVGLEIGKRYRPVEQVGALDLAVVGQILEFVLLETQRRTGPVRRGPADRLDDPCGQVGEILGDPPSTACCAIVQPGKLRETFPLVVDEIFMLDARTGFENDDIDALLRQLVAQSAAAGTGTDDDDHAVVVEIVRGCHDFLPEIPDRRKRATARVSGAHGAATSPPQSHSMSSKPRSM